MKKLILTAAVMFMTLGLVFSPAAQAYNFGDFRSTTLTTKAWNALAQDDIEAVLAYTNKCIELYGEQAQKMQESLDDYVQGDNDAVFAYWALNDVSTSYFIQGEAYRQANMLDEAQEAYQTAIDKYSYGQAWDPKGWFWKPAEAAKEKVAMLASGSTVDFGDYTSSFLTTQAWKALGDDDIESVKIYTDKVFDLYDDEARSMQESLTEYAWESKDKIFSYWALNDVGTSLFIRAEALKKAGDEAGAKEAYQKLVDEYFYAQCWDPKGWFWKPAEAAQQALDSM